MRFGEKRNEDIDQNLNRLNVRIFLDFFIFKDLLENGLQLQQSRLLFLELKDLKSHAQHKPLKPEHLHIGLLLNFSFDISYEFKPSLMRLCK